MSSFTNWFIAQQLQNMGWPKSKGLFRKVEYVDSMVLDVVVEQAIQIVVGLGAGRPQLGVALLADAFAGNPWTKESIDELIQTLKTGEADIADAPTLLPWKALYAKHKVASVQKEFRWQDLGGEIQIIWAMLIGKAVFWGLTHEDDMPKVFTKFKQDYEQTAQEAIPHLAIPPKLPMKTLDDFYESCVELVEAFESVRPPLPQVPTALVTTPIIAKRLV